MPKYLDETETLFSFRWFGGRVYLSRLFYSNGEKTLHIHFIPTR